MPSRQVPLRGQTFQKLGLCQQFGPCRKSVCYFMPSRQVSLRGQTFQRLGLCQ